MEDNPVLELSPFVGDGRYLDLPGRAVMGALPLFLYGLVGGYEQAFSAWGQGQIPLAGGFTLETPWTVPERQYVVGVPNQPQSFQEEAFLAGQRFVPGLPVRSHTTGLIDAGVRSRSSIALLANEFVHPGRAAVIVSETSRSFTDSPAQFQNEVGHVPGLPGVEFRTNPPVDDIFPSLGNHQVGDSYYGSSYGFSKRRRRRRRSSR